MPWFARFEGQLEADPSVRVYRLCRRLRRSDCHRAREVGVAVGGEKRLRRLRPVGGDVATADNSAGFHLEHIGEITPEGDFQVEAYRPLAVVDDVEVLVHPAIDRAAGANRHPRRAPSSGDRPVRAEPRG